MVNPIKSMACRHVQNMVQSVSKCSGNEAPYSPVIDTNSDSASSSVNTSKSCKISGQPEKKTECHSESDERCHSKNCLAPNISSPCAFHCEEDQQLPIKCAQSKKISHEDLDDRQSPNDYLWQKLEALIDQMISEEDGIPVRNVKSLMSVIPSTFTGSDIVHWLMEHTGASDVTEAVHLASRIASMGYIFCIDDHVLTVKNDGHTYYRFQTPFLYPSRCMEADTADYAVYLCKRTMQNKQRLELAGFEAERLASLQNIYCHKWEFIYIQVSSDIVHWLMEHTGASDVTEAVHLASRIASMGYIFCIDDHVLTVKNDGHTYYRFQTPFLYPSRCMEADTADYAVYLCKRTMQNKQRLELAGFEAERLASLQNIYCHKWEFIYIQAEAEAKVDKKRDKLERLVLESQERAYWDLHRPPPGCINTTDIDMRKLCRAKRPKKTPSRPVNFPIPSGPGQFVAQVFN
uniref:DEP domain-containing protein n=1 Tax=Trichobilharzia regenti TaxID=157069 RepID=A0AA85KI79_TRIRE|nr:unnamed protein product [Trichobilharzia regenti]